MVYYNCKLLLFLCINLLHFIPLALYAYALCMCSCVTVVIPYETFTKNVFVFLLTVLRSLEFNLNSLGPLLFQYKDIVFLMLYHRYRYRNR